MTETLHIKNLTKDFGSLRAVNNISFTARQGEIIALLGPNGAGKSTLMNMITGYLAPTSGEISVLGCKIADNCLFAKQNIGFLPEGSPLYPDLSVKAFLNYIAELRGLAGSKKDERLARVCRLSQIDSVWNQKLKRSPKATAAGSDSPRAF